MAAGVIALGLACLSVPWAAVLEAVRGTRPAFLAGSALVAVVAVWLRSLRLALLSGNAAWHRQAWRAYALGYLGSIVLPLGSGELVKTAAFQRRTGLGWTRSAAAVLLDRLMDLFGMAAVLGAMLIGGGLGAFRTESVGLILGALALVFAGLGLVVLKGEVPDRILAALDPAGNRPWVGRIRHHYAQAHQQALLLRTPGRAARVLALQVAVLALDTLGTWVSLQAFPFGTGIGLLIPLRLNLYLMFAAALPLLPGSIGTYQLACLLALHPLGLSLPQALAFALAAQATSLAFLLCQGLLALIRAPEHVLAAGPPPESDSEPAAPITPSEPAG
jgi:uncharacterized membrane protein YbhN (UPF0104 family)